MERADLCCVAPWMLFRSLFIYKVQIQAETNIQIVSIIKGSCRDVKISKWHMLGKNISK